jgi:hypothetical protein
MNTQELQQLNIYQKLHLIQEKIIGLKKDKKSFSYEYVTGTKILGFIKPLMNELGLLLKQEVVSIENTRMDYQAKNGAKTEVLSKVMMKFTWIDVMTGEMDENSFGANGQNDFEKGLGSALTYAERYFLLKYFHIATDEDDIDNPERHTSAPVIPAFAEERIGKAIAANAEQSVLDGHGTKWNLTAEQIITLQNSIKEKADESK